MAAKNSPGVHEEPLISIIVPTLNEEARIRVCLDATVGQQPPFEVIVVDGGSSDATTEIAESFGARVIHSELGRAKQMNTGAEVSNGSILLFLHADTVLPHQALEKARKAVDRRLDGGAFTMRFDCPRIDYLIASAAADIYCRVTGDMFGDRAMFVRRKAFFQVGGYREITLMEDLDIVVRLKKEGCRMGIVPGPVVSSARRFDQVGIWRGICVAWELTRAFHRGLPLDHLGQAFYSTPKR